MRKEWQELLARAEAQGWRAVPTKKGWRYLSPDGKAQVTVHRTPSDWRSLKNTLRDFRAGGLDREDQDEGQER